MTKKMYLVMVMSKDREVTICGYKSSISMCWADGMIGAMPVFSNKKLAKKYAGKHQILTIEASNNENQSDQA